MSDEDVRAVKDEGVAELARNRSNIVLKLGRYATTRVDPVI